MKKAELSVLRIFLTYGFEEPVGKYKEHQLHKVDRLMAECHKRRIKLIVALGNQLEGIYVRTYGPVDMYKDGEQTMEKSHSLFFRARVAYPSVDKMPALPELKPHRLPIFPRIRCCHVSVFKFVNQLSSTEKPIRMLLDNRMPTCGEFI